MNTIKNKVLVSAILSIVLCVSLIAGATFALFTSESDVNIAITSGKVDVVASIDKDSVSTRHNGGGYVEGTGALNAYASVSFKDGLAIVNFLPGDGIKFNIVVTNNSTVAVKYRTIISCETDTGLLEGLDVVVDGEGYAGRSIVSKYQDLQVAEDKKVKEITVCIDFPETAGNAYAGKKVELSYAVEAVQGNANVNTDVDNTYYVYNANDLIALQKETGVSKVEFVNDIDMTGKAWTGLVARDDHETTGEKGEVFAEDGVEIIGNGKYISGLSAPFIRATNKNVKIDDLTIKNSEMGNNPSGEVESRGFAAFIRFVDSDRAVSLSNCHLVDSKLNTTADTRVGGLVGVCYGSVMFTDCSVEGCELSAKGSVGGIVAQTGDSSSCVVSISGCSVSETKLSSTDAGNWRVGAIVGSVNTSTVTIANCTSTDNTLAQTGKVAPDHELFGRIVGGLLEIDGTVYCSAEYLKGILTASNSVKLEKNYHVVDSWQEIGKYRGENWATYVLDGNGHSISGLTQALIGEDAFIDIEIKNLTIKNSKIEGTVSQQFNTYNSGAFISYTDGGINRVVLDNCHTVNVDVTGAAGVSGESAGSLLGYISLGGNGIFSVTNCTVTDGSVTNAYGNAGGIVGMVMADDHTNWKIENCSVSGCELNAEKAEKEGEIVGTVNGAGSLKVNNCTVSNNKLVHDTAGKTNSIFGRVSVSNIVVDGKTNYCSSPATFAKILSANDETINVVLAGELYNIDAAHQYAVSISSLGTEGDKGQRLLGGANTKEINIDLGGHKLQLSTTYMSALGAVNSDAVITIKNGSLGSTQADMNWNLHDLYYFDCTWNFDGVTFDRAVAVGRGANVTMTNCSITDVGEVYALWITAEAGNVSLNNVNIKCDRAIAIKDQYVTDASKRNQIVLSLIDCTFETNKKAAVLVTNTAGAKITASGCDITKVTADSTNLVWIDSDKLYNEGTGYYKDYSSYVVVEGGTAVDEP